MTGSSPAGVVPDIGCGLGFVRAPGLMYHVCLLKYTGLSSNVQSSAFLSGRLL